MRLVALAFHTYPKLKAQLGHGTIVNLAEQNAAIAAAVHAAVNLACSRTVAPQARSIIVIIIGAWPRPEGAPYR
eukprot:1693809-Pyramimonas_sp.AAC.2